MILYDSSTEKFRLFQIHELNEFHFKENWQDSYSE